MQDFKPLRVAGETRRTWQVDLPRVAGETRRTWQGGKTLSLPHTQTFDLPHPNLRPATYKHHTPVNHQMKKCVNWSKKYRFRKNTQGEL